MPKRSKEHLELIKKRPLFLREREECNKKENAVFRVLDSVLKTRKSALRDRYVEELKAMITSLCVDSADLTEVKASKKELEAKYERSERKRTEAVDKLLRQSLK